MVHFVLNDASKQILDFGRHFFSMTILKNQSELFSAHDFSGDSGQAQTSFDRDRGPRFFFDHGVDHNIFLAVAHRRAGDEYLLGNPDLGRREAHAIGGMHGHDHVVKKFLHGRTKIGHRRRFFLEDWIGIGADLKFSHGGDYNITQGNG